MTILVTAASSHLGRLVVEALLERGTDPAELVATARDTTAISDLADRGVQVRRADYDDPASLAEAFAGVDRLLFVSGSAVGQRVPQHTHVIDAAAAAGVGLVVYTSAPHAREATDWGLAAEHRTTEELLEASGVPTVVLRNNWYLENYTGNAGGAIATGSVIGAAGAGRIAAAARRDFAEAAAVVLLEDGHAGRVYELGGDEPFTMAQYAAALSEVTGQQIGYTDLEPAAYAEALVGAGVPEGFAQVLADTDVVISQGGLDDDGHQLSRLIGRPTTPLTEAVRAALG